MFKLMKYEFRKNRTGLLVMLIIAAALFLLAPIGAALDNEVPLVLSVSLLMFYGIAAYIYVLVRGVSAWSGELKNRTGYLLLMTPHSPVTILFSKLLFTLAFSLVMLAICAAAMIGAGTILLGEILEIKGFFNIMKYTLLESGIDIVSLGYAAVFFLVQILGAVLSLVSISYFSVTLSATLLGRYKGKGFISFIFFVAFYFLVSRVTALLTDMDAILYASMGEALLASLPATLAQLGFTILFTGLSGALLRKWVSL